MFLFLRLRIGRSAGLSNLPHTNEHRRVNRRNCVPPIQSRRRLCSQRHRGRELFKSWYLAQAQRIIPPRVAAVARSMGVEVQKISVRELKYRWASCSPGRRLTFSWRIIQAPTLVVEYLIVHELAHLLEPNHSDKFWNIVAVHVPAWEKARDWLRRHGSRLEW